MVILLLWICWWKQNIFNKIIFICKKLNQNIAGLKIPIAVDVSGMFYGCTSFKRNIAGLDTSSVENYDEMFKDTTNFNQNAFKTTNNAVKMNSMFNGSSYNGGGLPKFIIPNLENASNMLDNSSVTTSKYSSMLINWASQGPNLQNGVNLGARNITYNNSAVNARSYLVNEKSWVITDAGLQQ